MKGERRAVARYRAKLPVVVKMGEHIIVDATAIEVSLAGLRVACEGLVVGRVLSQYIQVTPGENITANIDIKVPEVNVLVNNVHCLATLISVNRSSQARYIIGLKFLEFEEDGQQIWRDYISKKN